MLKLKDESDVHRYLFFSVIGRLFFKSPKKIKSIRSRCPKR